MKHQEVSQKLADLRAKYLQTDHGSQKLESLSDDDLRKLLAIKRKLADLEIDRCQKMRLKQDLSKIDQKILKQKELFSKAESKLEH